MDFTTVFHRVLMGFFVCNIINVCRAESQQPPAFEWRQVAPRIFVAFKLVPHRFIDSNVTLIEGDEALLIVDANENLDNARAVIKQIKQVSHKPVHYVVNTHWHLDHTLANALYRQAFPEIKAFVAHRSLLESMANRAKNQLQENIRQWQEAIREAEQQLAKGEGDSELPGKIQRARQKVAEWQSIELIKPQLVFDDQLTLPLKGISVRLLYYGKAHTEGDVVVYLPQQHVLIAGDLFDQLPYAGHGFPSEWLKTLQQIAQLDFDRVVPGHGELQIGKQQLQLICLLLQSAIESAQLAKAKGLSEADYLAGLDLTAWHQKFSPLDPLGERVFQQFIPEFFQRAFQELKGQSSNKTNIH